MWTRKCAEEIVEALRYLPLNKVFEARDFVRALREKHGYAQPVEEGEAWSEEDQHEWTQASLNRWEAQEEAEGPQE